MAKLERSGIVRIVTICAAIVIESVITFIAAGRVDLPRVWAYFGIVIVCQFFIFVLMFARFPQMIEVVNARGEIKFNKWLNNDKQFMGDWSNNAYARKCKKGP